MNNSSIRSPLLTAGGKTTYSGSKNDDIENQNRRMQQEMDALRAENASLKQQANTTNRVMDDHEHALLNKHLSSLRRQQGSTQSGRFTNNLEFGTSKDALNLAAFLGMSCQMNTPVKSTETVYR